MLPIFLYPQIVRQNNCQARFTTRLNEGWTIFSFRDINGPIFDIHFLVIYSCIEHFNFSLFFVII